MSRKIRLQDMTSAEFAERAKDKPVVLIPFGAQETQGPHIPMGDFVLADALATRVAERADCVVAPTLPFGDSEFYRSLPGCISLRPSTFVSVVGDICENLLDHGLDRLVIFNGQTSNAPLIDQAVRVLRRERGVYIPCLNIWRILTPAQMQAIYGDGLPGSQGHGGDPITSMFLHLFPDLARMDLLAAPKPFKQAMGLPTRSISSLDFKGVAVQMPLDMAQMSENGNLSGNGARSSAEIGAKIADTIVDFSAAFVDHFKTCDPRSLG
ncbi:creatininase family protein [Microvirga antarctica]|uniref:creatininase family protein n=1 Tax=Microvirga antarctica TaxID=2819233 RepID=UPI001B305C99|nr:creatininase family protein [Microvirga antarctica]